MDNKKRGPKKPLLYYYIMGIIVVLILNAFFFPKLQETKIKEISYAEFLTMLDGGNIQTVELTDKEIIIEAKPTDGKEEGDLYKTGIMPDIDITNRLKEANVKFYRLVPKENSVLVNFLVSWLIPSLIVFTLLQLFFRSMSKQMSGGSDIMSLGKSGAKMYEDGENRTTFQDVAGQDEAKDGLSEIVDFLHNPKKYADIGATMPKGVLLVGPPGTGKTLLAKAVAGEAKVPFFSISGSEFVEMFVGLGAKKVRDLFKQAEENAPCIIFIDEIDTIGKKRGDGGLGGNDEREQTLNQLLAEMDGFDGKEGIVMLAATNRPESLDKALLRPGRFDRTIPVELPDLRGREAILKVHAKKVKTGEEIEFNEVARATAGASGADLANIVNESALRAVRQNRKVVLQEDLTESVEVVIAGHERKNAVISPKEKRIIAYHEVGHALVAAMQDNSDPVHKITIIPRTSGALGYTMQLPEDESVLMSKEELFNKIVTLTGGRQAEALVFGSITSGASNDIEQATRLARAMVTRFGMTEKFGMMGLETLSNKYLGGDASLACSEQTSYDVDQEVREIIKEAEDKAYKILEGNRDKLTEISNYLLEMETITGEQFMNILKKDEE